MIFDRLLTWWYDRFDVECNPKNWFGKYFPKNWFGKYMQIFLMTVITHLWWSRGRCTQRAATRWGTLWTWWWWFDYADADDNDDADDENDDADDDDDMMMMMKSTFSGSLCRWGWRDSRARPPAQPIIMMIIILISRCVADPDKTWTPGSTYYDDDYVADSDNHPTITPAQCATTPTAHPWFIDFQEHPAKCTGISWSWSP